MQKNPQYKNLIEEISGFLRDGISRAIDLGVSEEKIIIDPGIGFGKSLEHNLEILKRLKEFRSLGRPVMVGVSRKAFIGKILNVPCGERLSGTLSACVLAARNGAKIVRVHDVKKVKDALEVADRINNI
jgi:dihydropteroate synthase